jgi:hypothetical protein
MKRYAQKLLLLLPPAPRRAFTGLVSSTRAKLAPRSELYAAHTPRIVQRHWPHSSSDTASPRSSASPRASFRFPPGTRPPRPRSLQPPRPPRTCCRRPRTCSAGRPPTSPGQLPCQLPSMPIRCRALLAPPAATVAAAAATPAEDGAAPAAPAQPASQETDATFGRRRCEPSHGPLVMAVVSIFLRYLFDSHLPAHLHLSFLFNGNSFSLDITCVCGSLVA